MTTEAKKPRHCACGRIFRSKRQSRCWRCYAEARLGKPKTEAESWPQAFQEAHLARIQEHAERVLREMEALALVTNATRRRQSQTEE